MADATRISIVATVRNEARGIAAFVESLLGQTRAPDEIVIVDGASTDGTLEILRRFEAAGRIRVVSQDCNIAQGRNLGVAAAAHELIAITDAGCVAAPDWLAHIAGSFAAEPSPDVVAANYDFDTRNDFERASVFATDAPDREESEHAKYFPSSRSIAFRKSAWHAAGGYPDWLYAAEDTLFNIRLRELGLRFAFCREARVTWRPRQTWKALWRQFVNYARGNGRIGLGFTGFRANLQSHGAFMLLLLGALAWWPLALAALAVAVQHVAGNLWQQALHAYRITGRLPMLWRTLVAMEFVRLASLWGFVRGRLDRRRRPEAFVEPLRRWFGRASVEDPPGPPAWSSAIMLAGFPATALAVWATWGWPAFTPALAAGVVLLYRSISNFSRTGPQLKQEILGHYRRYSLVAFGRLLAWALVLCVLLSAAGVLAIGGLTSVLLGAVPGPLALAAAGAAGIVGVAALQFFRHLLQMPGSIAASSSYRLSRFHPLWRRITPSGLRFADRVLAVSVIGGGLALAGHYAGSGDMAAAVGTCAMLLLLGALVWAGGPAAEAPPVPSGAKPNAQRMNVLMLGVDTLRADRLGIEGYCRPLTPTLDALAQRGTYFGRCFVPCGRTAPSLASMLTGTWPHTHGIRDNFTVAAEARIPEDSLPALLGRAGYRTVAISDWAGADLGKYPFGFAERRLPTDQWNIKYLIRQGPRDLRLFLSLFTHGRFGRRFLPEIYYLAGVPMTDELGRQTRQALSACACSERPFLINAFFSTTHAPFGSHYPYYTLFSERDYDGPSKFVMGLMNDPFEIIKQQQHTAEHFDLKQIHALYDGCVKQFDDEVAKILAHLDACGLADSTIVVVYSDHGIEFFERDSWGQGNSVIVDASSRVPLIVADPRQPAPVRIDSVARTVDLMPTLLDLLQTPVPAHVEGRSWAAAVNGEPPHGVAPPAFSETGIWFGRIPSLPEGHLHYPDLPIVLDVPDKTTGTLGVKREFQAVIVRAKDRAIKTAEWKLVYQPMEDGTVRCLLFDLVRDPTCVRNVAAEHPDVLRDLQRQLLDWMKPEEQLESAVADGADPVAPAKAGAQLGAQ
jgi:arylsulfatase A-like enzyme/glycosyltransferase involved in cell wall biosynthesis